MGTRFELRGDQIATYASSSIGGSEERNRVLIVHGIRPLGSAESIFRLETGQFFVRRLSEGSDYVLRDDSGTVVVSGLRPERTRFDRPLAGEKHVLFVSPEGRGFIVDIDGLGATAGTEIYAGPGRDAPTAPWATTEIRSPDGTELCLAEGMRVTAQRGRRPVQSLRPGSLVWTLDRGMQPLRWIGHRRIKYGAGNFHLRPILILAGALGRGCPSADILVQPEQRVLLTGWRADLFFGKTEVIVAAQALLEVPGFSRDMSRESITWCHLAFDAPEILEVGGVMAGPDFVGARTLGDLGRDRHDEIVRTLIARGGDCRGPGRRRLSDVDDVR